MSRPIKFRGKRIDNGEWVYGDLWQHQGNTWIVSVIDGEAQRYSVNSETVGQYTSLQDRNGKEIYDRDIVKYSYVYNGRTREFTAYVDWSEELLGYCLRNMDGTWRSEAHSYDFKACATIISNIFDHPHLLKGDDDDV